MRDLLIITNSYDVTTDLLLDRLEEQSAFRLNFDQFSQYSVLINKGGFSIEDPVGRRVSSQSVCKAYWRKPFNAPQELEHPCAAYVGAELRYVLTELVNLLWAKEALVLVEPYAERRTGKLVQLRCARHFFNVPEYEFLFNRKSRHGSAIIKSLANKLVGEDVLYTTRVEAGTLSAKYPWFIQREIEALQDVTVVFIRGRLFAFSLERDFLDHSVDWREVVSPAQPWRKHELPDLLKENVGKYMKALRLDYGRFDFLLDKRQRYWFCEVNPNGQFAWLDLTGSEGLLAAVTEEISPASSIYPLSNKHPLNSSGDCAHSVAVV